MKIETIEVSGFASALKAARLPYNKSEKSALYTDIEYVPDSEEEASHLEYKTFIEFNSDDIDLLRRLEETGDEHAKPIRGIMAYADIDAPIHFWCELETYRAGHERLFSASTMNTEGRRLKGLALQKVLREIPFDRPIHKIDCFSYQTLRRIVYQRYNHRKPEWHEFIEWVRSLPLAEELILAGLEKNLAVHDAMYAEYMEEVKSELKTL